MNKKNKKRRLSVRQRLRRARLMKTLKHLQRQLGQIPEKCTSLRERHIFTPTPLPELWAKKQALEGEQASTSGLLPYSFDHEQLEERASRVVIKEEFPSHDDSSDTSKSSLDSLPCYTNHIKEELEETESFIKQETDTNNVPTNILEYRIDELGSYNGCSIEAMNQISVSKQDLDLDSVDLLFLEFAKRFKTFSGKRQLSVKNRLCQILADAELEEAEERRTFDQ